MFFVKIMYIVPIRNPNFKLVYIRPIVKSFYSILWKILRENKSIYLANFVYYFTSTAGAYMEGLFYSNSCIEYIFVEQQLCARLSMLVIMVRAMMPKYIPSVNWNSLFEIHREDKIDATNGGDRMEQYFWIIPVSNAQVRNKCLCLDFILYCK